MDLGKQLDMASKSKFRLWCLNRILWRVVPFNQPHGLKIVDIQEHSIKIVLPYKRRNYNHIKGIHACALATLSEYLSGLSLLRVLDSKEYRLIMKSLKMDYIYQGKKDVFATFELNKKDLMKKINASLKNQDSILLPFSVDVFDINNNHISNGMIEWQIKPWKFVKTKF